MKTIQLAMAEETGNNRIDRLRIFVTREIPLSAREEFFKDQADILATALEQSLPEGTIRHLRERIRK